MSAPYILMRRKNFNNIIHSRYLYLGKIHHRLPILLPSDLVVEIADLKVLLPWSIAEFSFDEPRLKQLLTRRRKNIDFFFGLVLQSSGQWILFVAAAWKQPWLGSPSKLRDLQITGAIMRAAAEKLAGTCRIANNLSFGKVLFKKEKLVNKILDGFLQPLYGS